MKIIAHRGNIDGPNFENENKFRSIKTCIELGYDVEIDIRLIDNEFYLGHDKAEVKISKKKLILIKDKAWIHCKNLEAFSFFNRIDELFNYFWHENDSYTLTSRGYIWAYPGKNLSPQCICVMPEYNHSIDNIVSIKNHDIAGVCTDYPNLFN